MDAPQTKMSINSMPPEFYGGVNPVIKFKKVEKEIVLDKSVPTPAERMIAEKQNAAGGLRRLHPANLLANPKMLLLFGAAIFVLVLIGGSVYYFFVLRAQSPTAPLTPPVTTVPLAPEQTPEPLPALVPPEIIEPTTTPIIVSLETPMEFPQKALADTNDIDLDKLTDMEETPYGTDPAVPDTDGDGYNDGHEVFHLYSPIDTAPAQLVSSGKVVEYTNPTFNYTVDYLSVWPVGIVDSESRDVLFSDITGENIEIRVFDMLPNESFSDWFSRSAKDQLYADLLEFESVFGVTGFSRNDQLVYYFSANGKVFVISYHENNLSAINFRSTITMIARSFRLSNLVTSVPVTEQIISPEQTSTTTPVSNSTL